MAQDYKTRIALVSQDGLQNQAIMPQLEKLRARSDVDLKIYANADELASDLQGQALEQLRDDNRQLLIVSKGRLMAGSSSEYGADFNGVKKLLRKKSQELQELGINFFVNLFSGGPANFMDAGGAIKAKEHEDEYHPGGYKLNSTADDDILVTSPMDSGTEHFGKLFGMFDQMIQAKLA